MMMESALARLRHCGQTVWRGRSATSTTLLHPPWKRTLMFSLSLTLCVQLWRVLTQRSLAFLVRARAA